MNFELTEMKIVPDEELLAHMLKVDDGILTMRGRMVEELLARFSPGDVLMRIAYVPAEEELYALKLSMQDGMVDSVVAYRWNAEADEWTAVDRRPCDDVDELGSFLYGREYIRITDEMMPE